MTKAEIYQYLDSIPFDQEISLIGKDYDLVEIILNNDYNYQLEINEFWTNFVKKKIEINYWK